MIFFKKNKPVIENHMEGTEFHFKSLAAYDFQWMRLEDVIAFLKIYKEQNPHMDMDTLHDITKKFIQLKNSK